MTAKASTEAAPEPARCVGLLRTLAHRVRTPLASISLLAEMLEDTELTPRQSRQVADLRRAGGEVLAVIDDLVTVAQLDAGELAAASERPTTPLELGQRLEARYGRDAEGERVVFDLGAIPDPPPRLRTDPGIFERIACLLIDGALAAEAGTVSVRLAVEGAPPAFVMAVADGAAGLDPDARGGLFEPFDAASLAVQRRYGASGLGLPLARRLARHLGGELDWSAGTGGGNVLTASLAIDG